MTSGTASSYAYGGGVGYREDGIGPAGLSSAYGFQKVGARYYDPTFGCFLTRDTDLSQHPYAYCDGDPVNFSDPSGHDKKKTPPTFPVPPTQPTIPNTGPIPVGNSGGTVTPGSTPGSGTATTPPTPTGTGGSYTISIGGGGGTPTAVGAQGTQPLGGGTLKLNGTYNSTTGAFSGGGSYTHPIGGGFSGGVTFGSGRGPGYTLNFNKTFLDLF